MRNASDIIIHHWSNAYELFTYWSLLSYFVVATVTITTKLLSLLCHCYHYYHTTLLLNTLLQILSYPGVVELTTQLLILKNILWLPLCWINKFGLNTLPSKAVVIPYTCGLSRPVGSGSRSYPASSSIPLMSSESKSSMSVKSSIVAIKWVVGG